MLWGGWGADSWPSFLKALRQENACLIFVFKLWITDPMKINTFKVNKIQLNMIFL